MRENEGLEPGEAENGVSHAGRWRIKNLMSWKFVFCRGTRQELEYKKKTGGMTAGPIISLMSVFISGHRIQRIAPST